MIPPVIAFRVLFVVALTVLLPALRSVAAGRSPNIILVVTDDQGYGDLGCHGNTMIHTPNLDKLHGQSVRLTNFHVDPTCSPSRSALLTGRYSTRTGVWHTIMGRSLMFHDEITLGDLLSKNGYATAMFGKWHLGDNYPMRPQDRGFQEVLMLGGGGITQTPDFWGNTYFDDTYYHNGQPEKFQGYCTDVFFEQAIAFMERKRDHPFFIYLATNVPHGPFHVDKKYSDPYKKKGVPSSMADFYGMIENFDENLGRLLARVKANGLEKNTLLIFMTDNGTAAGIVNNPKANPPAWLGFNAGMRGQKGSAYDGGHRVPCFLRWPEGGIGGGKDISQLTAHIDLLPTILDLCGLKPAPTRALDGSSLVPLLKGNVSDWPARTLLVHSQRIEYPEKWRQSAVMTDRWRLINGTELYDISSDPAQALNRADQYPEEVAQLRQSYESWWEGLKPRFDEYPWIVVGAPQENPARITCHDWHSNRVPWNQQAIRAMPEANGYWMIEVARDGHYTFTLRHQPEIARFPLQASIARLQIGERKGEMLVPDGADAVTIPLTLETGRYRMQTWLEDSDQKKSRGAFFVEALRVE